MSQFVQQLFQSVIPNSIHPVKSPFFAPENSPAIYGWVPMSQTNQVPPGTKEIQSGILSKNPPSLSSFPSVKPPVRNSSILLIPAPPPGWHGRPADPPLSRWCPTGGPRRRFPKIAQPFMAGFQCSKPIKSRQGRKKFNPASCQKNPLFVIFVSFCEIRALRGSFRSPSFVVQPSLPSVSIRVHLWLNSILDLSPRLIDRSDPDAAQAKKVPCPPKQEKVPAAPHPNH
jgi:hypothetical protein